MNSLNRDWEKDVRNPESEVGEAICGCIYDDWSKDKFGSNAETVISFIRTLLEEQDFEAYRRGMEAQKIIDMEAIRSAKAEERKRCLDRVKKEVDIELNFVSQIAGHDDLTKMDMLSKSVAYLRVLAIIKAISAISNRKVTRVTWEDTKDELYTYYGKCECGNNCVIVGSMYCSECGKRIVNQLRATPTPKGVTNKTDK